MFLITLGTALTPGTGFGQQPGTGTTPAEPPRSVVFNTSSLIGEYEGSFDNPMIGSRPMSMSIKAATAPDGRIRHRHLPVPGHRKEWAEQGAVFSYGANYFSVGRTDAGGQ